MRDGVGYGVFFYKKREHRAKSTMLSLFMWVLLDYRITLVVLFPWRRM